MARKTRSERLQSKVPATLSKKPRPVKLRNLQYDPEIFSMMSTDTVVDDFFSNKCGLPRACNYIVVGDPGVGKTTVTLDMLADAGRQGAKVLFISAEMNEIDMYEYMERFPKFGNVDILFMADYADENPKLVIEQMLAEGYDLVLGDSFVEITDAVKEICYMTSTGAEKWLIDLMCKHNKADNKAKKYTTFLMIQQVTKGGKFVGSNKLKHNTTGMLEIRFDGSSDNAPRYIEFSKNRRGNVGKKLYFTLDKPGAVNYMADKWHLDEENRIRVENELAELAKEAAAFDELLNLNESESKTAEAVNS